MLDPTELEPPATKKAHIKAEKFEEMLKQEGLPDTDFGTEKEFHPTKTYYNCTICDKKSQNKRQQAQSYEASSQHLPWMHLTKVQEEIRSP